MMRREIKLILKYFLCFVLVISMIVVGGIFGLYLFRTGGSVFLPNVVGMDVGRVLERYGSLDIPVTVKKHIFSNSIPRNHVVEQIPTGGRRIRKGRTIGLIISLGSRDVVVPKVVGENVNRAETLVRLSGLRVKFVGRLYDSEVPFAQVMGIWPSPKTKVARGEGVVLIVSQGPRERAYSMPKIVGESVNTGLDVVRKLGLTVGRVKYVNSKGIPRGYIISQVPLSGKKVLSGHSVHVKVARGLDQITGNFSVLRYTVPIGSYDRRIKIVLVEKGKEKEIFSKKVKSGEKVHTLVPSTGYTRVKIFLDNVLVEEQDH
ncbi:MAG: PASTA domain-containing protein [Nitrospinota bacterium]|nr:PASTA domain-containing protein [Nitrospinota bacterium]